MFPIWLIATMADVFIEDNILIHISNNVKAFLQVSYSVQNRQRLPEIDQRCLFCIETDLFLTKCLINRGEQQN